MLQSGGGGTFQGLHLDEGLISAFDLDALLHSTIGLEDRLILALEDIRRQVSHVKHLRRLRVTFPFPFPFPFPTALRRLAPPAPGGAGLALLWVLVGILVRVSVSPSTPLPLLLVVVVPVAAVAIVAVTVVVGISVILRVDLVFFLAAAALRVRLRPQHYLLLPFLLLAPLFLLDLRMQHWSASAWTTEQSLFGPRVPGPPLLLVLAPGENYLKREGRDPRLVRWRTGPGGESA